MKIQSIKSMAVALTIAGLVSLPHATHATLVDGLVAYYPLNGDANDATGNGNNATTLNTTYGLDRYNAANSSLSFNGTASRMTVAHAPLNFGQDGYAVSLWFKFNDASLTSQPLIFTSGRTPGLGIMYNDAPTVPNAINWSIGNNVGPGWIESYQHGNKSDYVSGDWYQLLFQKDHDQYSMFINGALESTLTIPTSFSFESGLDFGFLDGAQYLNGNLDDIRIYNRALSDSEVKELYSTESTSVPDNGSWSLIACAGVFLFGLRMTFPLVKIGHLSPVPLRRKAQN